MQAVSSKREIEKDGFLARVSSEQLGERIRGGRVRRSSRNSDRISARHAEGSSAAALHQWFGFHHPSRRCGHRRTTCPLQGHGRTPRLCHFSGFCFSSSCLSFFHFLAGNHFSPTVFIGKNH
ncbi:hypothetical protein CsSME_00007546 [Camellia sinensis var. sinensis]